VRKYAQEVIKNMEQKDGAVLVVREASEIQKMNALSTEQGVTITRFAGGGETYEWRYRDGNTFRTYRSTVPTGMEAVSISSQTGDLSSFCNAFFKRHH
jgi:hypothetical protein